MHRKARRPSRRVNQVFILFGVQHLHAQINHIARRKVLPLFSFTGLVDQILECLIHHIEVRVKQFDVLQRRHTDRQMGGTQRNFVPLIKHALAISSLRDQQILNFLSQCGFRLPRIAKLQHSRIAPISPPRHPTHQTAW